MFPLVKFFVAYLRGLVSLTYEHPVSSSAQSKPTAIIWHRQGAGRQVDHLHLSSSSTLQKMLAYPYLSSFQYHDSKKGTYIFGQLSRVNNYILTISFSN